MVFHHTAHLSLPKFSESVECAVPYTQNSSALVRAVERHDHQAEGHEIKDGNDDGSDRRLVDLGMDVKERCQATHEERGQHESDDEQPSPVP